MKLAEQLRGVYSPRQIADALGVAESVAMAMLATGDEAAFRRITEGLAPMSAMLEFAQGEGQVCPHGCGSWVVAMDEPPCCDAERVARECPHRNPSHGHPDGCPECAP